MPFASDVPDPVVAQAGAVTVNAAGRQPATLVLGGTLDAASIPDLEAAIAAVAATGRLLVDAVAVDRFDPATWAALVRGCGRAAITGIEYEVSGLRWAQVLDVLAAVPVSEIAAQVASVRALRPDHRNRGPGRADSSTAAAARPPAAAAGVGTTTAPPSTALSGGRAGTGQLDGDRFQPDPPGGTGRGSHL